MAAGSQSLTFHAGCKLKMKTLTHQRIDLACGRQRGHLIRLIMLGVVLVIATLSFTGWMSGTRKTYRVSHETLRGATPWSWSFSSHADVWSPETREWEVRLLGHGFSLSVETRELW